ncbi:MAG TPA: DUF4079 domain-containing protein [Cyanobacteria bacterium UBA11149]|nr:DUF4079 domain-containing protein [Cyanobacteria bacterium UBA11367]HBE58028.1 DUF4079 domain-containing protein [Cyanobacteria bacterium UBA11366]HBK66267.1 DUF4079 domain-containing protein [Cyanobacteria bacterium UBA11166]HBR72419.1 DUF4079 domain-containing protein [Cyanobacteria bacterium UBA11159]HBS71956.1 DUF4079 domain-containing protein [Cyanobacteria bacterium UBA11153]HBW90548.1 DUF4079 domain-containing protein [Cyanobacteria bacterium UBA11149]HCA93937.1 DUF4079 domain-conta
MDIKDIILLLHPAIAVLVVFPMIGIVVHRAWQTRQRRLETAKGGKSKIPPIVGSEHVQIGRWLTGFVVGITLLALAYATFKKILTDGVWTTAPFQVILIVFMYVATIISLVFLYQAREKHWRGIFATLTGMGVVILGFQDGVYRRDNEWFVSHFYYGIVATLLMIFSLAIVQNIYQDRSLRWRNVHIILNCIALLLFIGQGMTGVRDLLEIPLSWQEEYLYKCDYEKKTCANIYPSPSSEIPSVNRDSFLVTSNRH